MIEERLGVPDFSSVGEIADFELGDLRVRPRERFLQFEATSVAVEPLVMQLLVALSQRAGELVSRRDIFDICWGSAAVGDDSLNRVVAGLRKALQQTTAGTVRIETVPSAGYVLKIANDTHGDGGGGDHSREVERAIAAAFDSWRLGLPEPDHVRLEQLRAACSAAPFDARAAGMLALLCRHATEYGGPNAASKYLRECEGAARRAIEIDPHQPEALTALASIVPLFGGWSEARHRLTNILEVHPDHPVATQDLATLEMATGRIRVSKLLRDGLIARDPLAATYCYKSVYQHWSIGDFARMDHVADRAIQLWPNHPAVWMVRLWTLAYTGRVPAAIAMLDDGAVRPNIPKSPLTFLRQMLPVLEGGGGAAIDAAAEASLDLARSGPVNAMAAIFALGILDRQERLFELTEGYYLRGGGGPVPVSHSGVELSLNEQHRRLTQVLFTPVFAKARKDPRFMVICERIGLRDYWEDSGLVPDFLA